jgi:hypothetical protein
LEDRTVSPHRQGTAGPTAVHAIEEAVGQVDPDLGFRLFLRLLTALSVLATKWNDQATAARAVDEYVGIGARLDYGEYRVFQVEDRISHG